MFTDNPADIDPSTPLLYILRNDLELKGPRLERQVLAWAQKVICPGDFSCFVTYRREA